MDVHEVLISLLTKFGSLEAKLDTKLAQLEKQVDDLEARLRAREGTGSKKWDDTKMYILFAIISLVLGFVFGRAGIQA